MHLRTLFAVLIFCFALQISSAQERGISKDSMDLLVDKLFEDYYDYNYKSSMESAAQLISEASKVNDHYYLFRGYNGLGQIHYATKDTARGKLYFEKSLEQAKLSKVDSLVSWAYNDLGNVYSENYANYKETIGFYEKAIEVNKNAGLKETNSLAQYMNIAWTYLDVGQYKNALPYLEKAEKLSTIEKQHPLLYLNLEILLGRYYYYDNQNGNAIEVFTEAAKSAGEQNYMDQASQSHEYLAKIYEKNGDYKSANDQLKKQYSFDERIHRTERAAEMVEAGAKYEVEEYQKDLELAKTEQKYSEELVEKSNLLSTILIITSLVFLVAFVSIYLLAKARKKYIRKMQDTNAELTEAKEKAEKLSTLKTQFFSTVSHELRTPLYGVIGLSSILLEDKELSSHEDDLKSLKFSADYLLALINDVLMLNKMDADGVKLEKTPYKLSRLLKNITKSFAFSLEQHNSKIHLEIDKRLPDYLLGDSIRLSQILMNLVGNAVKFNENGNIWISVTLLEQANKGFYYTKFSVKDDGIGIPLNKQKDIFEEFSQVENNNYNYQGTGLGLPIVKKLLALHNSEIHLESTPDKGATFSFNLYLEEDKIQEGKPKTIIDSRRASNQVYNFENLHILVVDDNKINQKITHKILTTRGFSCSLADGGKEAIALARTNEYSLILMDIHMPEVGGIEATTEIRGFNKETPIVALTAVEADEIREKIIDCGMNDIILKPYDVSQFLNTILRNLNSTYELDK